LGDLSPNAKESSRSLLSSPASVKRRVFISYTDTMTCEACGGDSVIHPLEYAGVAFDMALGPLERVMPRFSAPGLWALLRRFGLAQELAAPDDKTLLLDRVLWQEAGERGIVMREYRPWGSPRNSFIARLPDGRTLDFDGVPIPREGVWWVNNKDVMKRRFSKAGLPVPKGGAALTASRALKIFRSLPHPVVVKPVRGSASRHTTMHIKSEDELVRAFKLAKQISPMVSIEEELEGDVYRPTLVGGRLIATLRRDQPHVVGDGASTIKQLVERANAHPARSGPYFSRMSLDAHALKELEYQGLTPESVPTEGRKVKLHQKINWALGGTTEDVTEEVHPENRALFERAAEILKSPLVGLDFIIPDISKPWHTQRCGIIECNDMPYFDNHHLPFEGTPRDVAGPLWDLVLSS